MPGEVATTPAAALSRPIDSVADLLSILVPFLQALDPTGAVPSLPRGLHQPSSSGEGTSATSLTRRKAWRQLPQVQALVLCRIWADWEQAIEAELGAGSSAKDELLSRLLFPRYDEALGPAGWEADIAVEAYAVCVGLLRKKQGGLLQGLQQADKAKDGLSKGQVGLVTTTLERLVVDYSVERVFERLLVDQQDDATPAREDEQLDRAVRQARWDAWLADYLSIPTRVANAHGKAGLNLGAIPDALCQHDFTLLSLRSLERLLAKLSTRETISSEVASSLAQTLAAVNPGSVGRMDAALFSSIVQKILPPPFPAPIETSLARSRYTHLWQKVALELGSADLERLLLQLAHSFESPSAKASEEAFSKAKAHAFVLHQLFGDLAVERSEEVFSAAFTVLLQPERNWTITAAHRTILWIMASEDPKTRTRALQQGMERVMRVWSNEANIKAGTSRYRLFVTQLLLLFVVSFPRKADAIVALGNSRPFIQAVSTHMSILAPSTRMAGLLAAEIVSERSLDGTETDAPSLKFDADTWEAVGGEEIKEMRKRTEQWSLMTPQSIQDWIEPLRASLAQQPGPAPRRTQPPRPAPTKASAPVPQKPKAKPLISVIDGSSDEEELEAYAMEEEPASETIMHALRSDDSSLFSSAVPSAAVTAAKRKGKMRAPVYVSELTAYLRGLPPDPGAPQAQADEEAERLQIGLASGAELIRRKAGWGGEVEENAVDLAVVLATMQDQYEIEGFHEQKVAVMTALTAAAPKRATPALIEQYFSAQLSTAARYDILSSISQAARELAGLPVPQLDKSRAIESFPSKKLPPQLHAKYATSDTSALDRITSHLTKLALEGAKEEAEQSIPEAAREKLLSVQRPGAGKTKTTPRAAKAAPRQNIYNTLATEFFVMPLINRFWLHLRELSTAPRDGSLPLLSPLQLTKYFATLAILLHAAQNAPGFSLSLVPAAIELVLALRQDCEVDEELLASAMELLLVVFDCTTQRDGGYSLIQSVTEGPRMVLDVKAWAEGTFEREERKGGLIGRAGRAAAGVLLRMEEVLGKYKGALGWA